MMYNQKLVASIKANNKILREFKDTVYVPFASEYSILIKNLNTVRALVHVFIDGENQTPNGLVVNAGSQVDFERSLKNGSLTEGNRFKFIERTGAVEQHRGIGLEDGIVRIEYQFEIPRPILVVDNTYDRYKSATNWTPDHNTWTLNSINELPTPTGSIARGTSALNNVSFSTQAVAQNVSYNDAGITVAGSKSTQSFGTTYMGALDPTKHVIVLKMLGETPDNKPVVKPVTVKHKPKCPTCGRQNKATSKFCTACGTHLEIFA